MINDPPPCLNFQLTMLLDQAIAGGGGTAHYLDEMRLFANLASYLNETGAAAYVQSAGPNGTQEATATDGTTTLNVNLQLNSLSATASDADAAPSIEGLAQFRCPCPTRNASSSSPNLALASPNSRLAL